MVSEKVKNWGVEKNKKIFYQKKVENPLTSWPLTHLHVNPIYTLQHILPFTADLTAVKFRRDNSRVSKRQVLSFEETFVMS